MSEITELLQRVNAGNPATRDALFELIYQDLCRLARSPLVARTHGPAPIIAT